MRHLFIGSILVFLTAGTLVGYRYLSITYETPFVPRPSSPTLEPPRRAIPATLTQTTGTVKHWVRGAQEATHATISGTIAQGESILTEDAAAVIALSDLGTITLGSNTQINFVSLLPEMLVVSQTEGTINYTITPAISIRLGNALVELTGEATISRSATRTIAIQRGSAKLAILSDENVTNVWDIKEGQTARVSATNTVTIR